MAGGSQETHAELLRELAGELRQFQALGTSFFRAAAARSGLTATDVQVIDVLERTGPMTAGQLAGLTGLTTGAITGMLNRLETAGLVRREQDPDDGRRVIVQLNSGKDDLVEIVPLLDSLGRAWERLAARYDDEQIAFLLDFLKSSNALSREELVRLQEAPAGEGGIFSAPLGELTTGRLVISGFSQLIVRADSAMSDLYQARFEGPSPEVKAKDGVVTIRNPRRLWVLGGKQHLAEVTLSGAIPWQIVLQGGAAEVIAELGHLNLAGLEAKGGMSMMRLDLPTPSSVVPVRISGGASQIIVKRPSGVAARVHLKGWASHFAFDEQSFSNLGNDVRLQSPGYDGTTPGYDIEVATSVSMVTITAG